MKKIFYITSMLALFAIANVHAQKPAIREATTEANVAKGSTVRIFGANRKLNIKSWDQPKVKVTVQIAQDSSWKETSNEEMLEALGISVKSFSNRVEILANRSTSISSLNAVTVAGFPSRKKVVQTTPADKIVTDRAKMAYAEDLLASTNRQAYTGQQGYVLANGSSLSGSTANIISMDIMVPAGSKLSIDNQYGDVIIGMNLEEAKLNISNGALDMQDVKYLELTGKYCNANFGNIEKAEIEFQNGTFHAQSITDLDLDSKYSTIEFEKGKYMYLRSQADNIVIEEIDKVDGRKTYGSIRIDMLNGNFDLEGNNVDIKLKNINPAVEMIKISNKYGDVRLPVKNLKNYFVDFSGYYSTVFTPFLKTIVKEEEKKPGTANAGKDEKATSEQEMFELATSGDYFQRASSLTGELAPKRFTGTVGDVSGKHTKFQLTCHSCTVDFK